MSKTIINQVCVKSNNTASTTTPTATPKVSQDESRPSASATAFHNRPQPASGKSLSEPSKIGSRASASPEASHSQPLKSSCVSKRYFLVPRENRKSYNCKAVVEIHEDGSRHLFSYNTRVAQISSSGVPVVFDIQSATTLRHIKSFLMESGFDARDRNQVETLCLAA